MEKIKQKSEKFKFYYGGCDYNVKVHYIEKNNKKEIKTISNIKRDKKSIEFKELSPLICEYIDEYFK